VSRLTIGLSRGCEVESLWLLVRFWSLGCDHVLVLEAIVMTRALNFVNKLSDISDHKGMHITIVLHQLDFLLVVYNRSTFH
jgi:hypothetical protein